MLMSVIELPLDTLVFRTNGQNLSLCLKKLESFFKQKALFSKSHVVSALYSMRKTNGLKRNHNS